MGKKIILENKREKNKISQRKQDHLDICLNPDEYAVEAGGSSSFDQVHFVHNALPEINFEKVETEVEFLQMKLKLPLLISCMTGGSIDGLNANLALAKVAQSTGIAIGLGSIRPAIVNKDAVEHFSVKKHAPDVPVLANIGAVQLRDIGIGKLASLLAKLEVQALVIHLNVGQELFQSNGDRNFCGLLDAIARSVANLKLPVVVKETGFGIRPKLVNQLLNYGVEYVDVAGSGGTNWITVEGYRESNISAGRVSTFASWGIPTAVILASLKDSKNKIIASGGLRDGLQLSKAIALGAITGGMALPFIRAVITEGVEGAIRFVDRVSYELKVAMTLSGANSISELQRVPVMKSRVFQDQVEALNNVDQK